MAYEVRFYTESGAQEYNKVLSAAGITVPQGASINALTGRAWNAVGAAPSTPQGTRLTYSSGARGPTPNVPDFVVEAYSISFNPQVVENSDLAAKYYLTTPAYQYLRALAWAYQIRPDMTTRARLRMDIRRLLQENTPEWGVDASTAYSNVEQAVVVPTYIGFTDTALVLNVDILVPGETRIDNYDGPGGAAGGGGGGGGGPVTSV